MVRLAGDRVGDVAVVTTGAGDTVAIWERSTSRANRVLAAVRPRSGEWRAPKVLASWPTETVQRPRGNPRLATGPNNSVAAVWVSSKRRVVLATWREPRGWGSPHRLSAKKDVARGPDIASNDAGRLAVTWQSETSRQGVLIRAAVKRGNGWSRSTVGKAGPLRVGSGPRRTGPVDPAQVGIDDAGNVSAAWYRVRPKPKLSGAGPEVAQNRSLASRLGVGAKRWEAPHPFGPWEPYFDGERSSAFVVEDDGTAWLADWAGSYQDPQRGPVWKRVGAGGWKADDRAPYADNFVTNDAGELISWVDSNPFAEDEVHTRQPDGSWTSAEIRATTVVLNDAGHAAAVGITEHTVWVRVRDITGEWGPETEIVRNDTRGNDRSERITAAASIDAEGLVTVLWRTFADQYPGDHPERGPDLRSVQFSAVSAAP